MKNKVIEVSWKDSRSWSEWNDPEDVARWASDNDAIMIVSVGYVLEENDRYILIAQSRHGLEGGVGNVLLVPKETITSIDTLGLADELPF